MDMISESSSRNAPKKLIYYEKPGKIVGKIQMWPVIELRQCAQDPQPLINYPRGKVITL